MATTERMTAFDWEGATARERDEWVAEHVMGRDFCRCPKDESTGWSVHGICWDDDLALIRVGDCWSCRRGRMEDRYTADARADYAVLKHVRETWLFSQRAEFTRQLHGLLRNRPLGPEKPQAWPDCLMEYTPGDYSRAAFLAASPPSP